jgi:hypothetical protein
MRAGALVIGNDPFFNSHSEPLAALSVRHAMPTRTSRKTGRDGIIGPF